MTLISIMETEVISVRVRKGTATRLKGLGVNSSERVRHYLENLAWREEARRTIDELAEIVKKHSKPSKAGFAVESIREDRNAAH
jgi:hypothetical protein